MGGGMDFVTLLGGFLAGAVMAIPALRADPRPSRIDWLLLLLGMLLASACLTLLAILVLGLRNLADAHPYWTWAAVGVLTVVIVGGVFLYIRRREGIWPFPRTRRAPSEPFVPFTQTPGEPLVSKLAAWTARANETRKERARIRAWLSLRQSLRHEPLSVELDQYASLLYERNDDPLDVTEKEIRAYLSAGGTVTSALQPWNMQPKRDRKDVDREINHWMAVGEQLDARLARQSGADTTDDDWHSTERDLADYISACLLLLHNQRPKYWKRLADDLKRPSVTTNDNRGDPLRERVKRVLSVLRDALEDEAGK